MEQQQSADTHGTERGVPVLTGKLPLMIWYGIEPAVADDPARAVQMLGECRIPKIREFLARRIASL
jgi:hypothetical protein